MKVTSIPQVRYVGGHTRQEAAEEFNNVMLELAPLHPRYERDGEGFYIYYEVIRRESENIAEEHELRGERHFCGECRNCIKSLNRFGEIDTRKKRATCGATGVLVRLDQPVCDKFYEEEGV